MTLNLLTCVVRQSFFLLICADVYKMNIFHFQKGEKECGNLCYAGLKQCVHSTISSMYSQYKNYEEKKMRKKETQNERSCCNKLPHMGVLEV